MRRLYPEGPIVAVAAVIFVEEAVLLARRKQEPGRGLWSLPGGMVELGETLPDALKRELWEEVSIKIEIGGFIGAFDRIIRDKENRVQYHYVLVDYWGRIVSGRPIPASDISEVQLVAVDEIETFDIDTQLKKTIRTAIRMRNHSRHSIGCNSLAF